MFYCSAMCALATSLFLTYYECECPPFTCDSPKEFLFASEAVFGGCLGHLIRIVPEHLLRGTCIPFGPLKLSDLV